MSNQNIHWCNKKLHIIDSNNIKTCSDFTGMKNNEIKKNQKNI